MRALAGLPKGGHYAVLLLLAFPAVAQAQWTDRARVSVNVGVEQPASTTFTGTTAKPVYAETATVNTSYGVAKSVFFDGGVLVRLTRGLGVGAAVSSFTKSSTATITGSIPHPFFFNTPRSISGTASSERSETAVHVQVAYVISSRKISVAISGGPTFFNVSQDLVAEATYTETYPYDAATFSGATTSSVSTTKVGFNAGADVAYKFSKNVGVGGVIRYSRASAVFPLANTASGVSADVGGLQAGGGIRFFF